MVEQSEEHPSTVTRVFPSSQTSAPALSPSPHSSTHASLAAFGGNPAGQALHVSGVVAVPPVHL